MYNINLIDMVRILLFGCMLGICFMSIYLFAMWMSDKKVKHDDNVLIQSAGELKKVKKNSEDWWYSVPHWHIMSNGEKINIAEYVTWEDWHKRSEADRYRLCLQIENRILKTTENNTLNKITID